MRGTKLSPVGAGGLRAGRRVRDKGVVLIVALGVLVVLAMLATVFATMTGIERSVARNYVDKVRARLLAESGIEHALGAIRQTRCLDIWNNSGPLPWIYFGGDRNADGVADPGDTDTNADGYPDNEMVRLDDALRPSFAWDRDANGTPDLITVNGKQVGISGVTQVGTYAPEGNAYALRVTDLNSRININNRHEKLATILNNLARRLGLSNTLGDTIVAQRAARPDQRFDDLDQLVPDVTRDTVDRLRPYVTVRNWVDAKTIKPIGVTAGRRRRNVAIGDSVYALWELRPKGFQPIAFKGTGTGVLGTVGSGTQADFQDFDYPNVVSLGDFEPRSPINVNTASFEVLAAVLEGLKGVFLKEAPNSRQTYGWYQTTLTFSGNSVDDSGQVGILYETPPIGPKTADNIAREILKARRNWAGGTGSATPPTVSVFRSYQQLADFFDQLPDSVCDPGEFSVPPSPVSDGSLNGSYVGAAMRDVLKANFDPNCHLNELNPDEVVVLKVDKTDLTYWTTEFCFVPMGYFEIGSLGRVLDESGVEIASESIVAEVKCYDVQRDTTQADFQKDFYMNDDYTAIDIPGAASGIESELLKTFSAKPTAENYAVRGHLAAYPEFYYDPGLVQYGWYDGYIGLKPKTSFPDGPYLQARFVPNNGSHPNTSLNNFTGSAPGSTLVVDPGGGPWYDRAIGGPNPGTLMPDGALSEKDATPGYDNGRNFNQHSGSMLLWVKPAFEPENAGKPRFFVNLTVYDMGHDGFFYWPGVNSFGMVFAPNEHLPFEGDKVRYESGDGTYNKNSIMAGYAGAFVRHPKPFGWAARYMTWNDQVGFTNRGEDPDSVPPNEQADIVGLMRDRIVVNGTPTLNHIRHGHASVNDAAGNPWGNLLMRGRWIHLGMAWNDSVGSGKMTVFANGKEIDWDPSTAPGAKAGQNVGSDDAGIMTTLNAIWGRIYPDDAGRNIGLPPDYGTAPGNPQKWKGGRPGPEDVPLKLGGVAASPLCSDFIVQFKQVATGDGSLAGKHYSANYPADATISEALSWKQKELTGFEADEVYKGGRFYKSYGTPDKANTNGTLAAFTSARIKFLTNTPRTLPPRGTATAPATGGGTTTSSTTTLSLPAGSVQLGLVAYTLRVPKYAQLGLLFPSGKVPTPKVYWDILDAGPQSSLLSGAATMDYPRGGGAITFEGTSTGKPITVDATKDIRYRFWLDSGLGDVLNDPYTASPIVDDVIVTFIRPSTQYFAWKTVNE